ncbi:MAG: UvrD-helicase domain-containing protein, partial [Hyphomicrobiales bacterium]|nr:UvrD-helicase domain-containing protein [Hyphomicrobiales bacterium]
MSDALANVEAAQRAASDPRVSAWVTANAGSGKTHVLVNRVLRLMLDGVAPDAILCLTYTRAAAATMSARAFEALARWTRLDDGALREEIARVGAVATVDLAFARRLFAKALETPGGLKIQTVHAFAERLLHAFPFESGAPAGFSTLEEVDAADLFARAFRRALLRFRADSALADALALALRDGGAATFEKSLRDQVAALDREEEAGGDPDGAGVPAALAEALGVARPAADVGAEILAAAPHGAELSAWIAALEGGAKTDRAFAERLRDFAVARDDDRDALDALEDAFFRDGAPRKQLGTKATRAAHPAAFAAIDALAAHLPSLFDELRATRDLERTLALRKLAGVARTEFARAKRRAGRLEFRDLVTLAARLLEGPAKAWVRHKLDARIDHVLVDEAQDTSPAQWRIVDALTDEFFAGAGTRPAARTMFAVGDPKQTIYAFAGADPKLFASEGHRYRELARGAGARFEAIALRQ